MPSLKKRFLPSCKLCYPVKTAASRDKQCGCFSLKMRLRPRFGSLLSLYKRLRLYYTKRKQDAQKNAPLNGGSII